MHQQLILPKSTFGLITSRLHCQQTISSSSSRRNINVLLGSNNSPSYPIHTVTTVTKPTYALLLMSSNLIKPQVINNKIIRMFSSLIGQPTPTTHPGILNQGEITPGIPREEYIQRRKNLVNLMEEGSMAIVAGYELRYATSSIFHQFHQNTDLYYLTGLNEPDCTAIIEKNQKYKDGYKCSLWLRPKDVHNEVWDGPRTGLDGATGFFNAHEAFPISNLPSFLSKLVTDATSIPTTIYADLPLLPSPTSLSHPPSAHASATTNTRPAWTRFAQPLPSTTSKPSGVAAALFGGGGSSQQQQSLSQRMRKLAPLVAELRIVKSENEVKVMRKAGRISGRAFVETMAATKPDCYEYELHAAMEFGVRRRGADGLAYVPVVAAGKNALTLHYVMNKSQARAGDLLLMDAGGEYGGYASDITRTWPVSGKFTKPQREIYEIVLSVQKTCIEMCTVLSSVSLEDLQRISFELLRKDLQRLFNRRLTNSDMSVLCPHHVGHWIGLDVHDTGSITRTRKLVENNAITIEPGVYVPTNMMSVPEEYRGIGVRIEDDVVIGLKTPTVLTVEAPKEISDVEAACEGWVSPKL